MFKHCSLRQYAEKLLLIRSETSFYEFKLHSTDFQSVAYGYCGIQRRYVRTHYAFSLCACQCFHWLKLSLL